MKHLKTITSTKMVGKINNLTGKYDYDIKHVATILDSSDSEDEDTA
jgi:hypothetical protein